MIVRISNEGQYEVDEGDVAKLNELDNEAVAACESLSEAAFHKAFDELLDFVRKNGRMVGDDDLVGSDMILPPADVSLAEARSEFQGEGLIPG